MYFKWSTGLWGLQSNQRPGKAASMSDLVWNNENRIELNLYIVEHPGSNNTIQAWKGPQTGAQAHQGGIIKSVTLSSHTSKCDCKWSVVKKLHDQTGLDHDFQPWEWISLETHMRQLFFKLHTHVKLRWVYTMVATSPMHSSTSLSLAVSQVDHQASDQISDQIVEH